MKIRPYMKTAALVAALVVVVVLVCWFRSPMGTGDELRWSAAASALDTVDVLALAETKDRPGLFALVGIDTSHKRIAPLVDLRSQGVSVIEARFTNSERRIVLSTLGADGRSKILRADLQGTIDPDDSVPEAGAVRWGTDMDADESVLFTSLRALGDATPASLPLGDLADWMLMAVNGSTGFALRVGEGRDAWTSPVNGEFIYLAPPGVTFAFLGQGDPDARYVMAPYRAGTAPARLVLSHGRTLAALTYRGAADADVYAVHWDPFAMDELGTITLPATVTGDALRDSFALADVGGAPGVLAAAPAGAGLALTLSTRAEDGSMHTAWSLALPAQITALYPTDDAIPASAAE